MFINTRRISIIHQCNKHTNTRKHTRAEQQEQQYSYRLDLLLTAAQLPTYQANRLSSVSRTEVSNKLNHCMTNSQTHPRIKSTDGRTHSHPHPKPQTPTIHSSIPTAIHQPTPTVLHKHQHTLHESSTYTTLTHHYQHQTRSANPLRLDERQ